MIDFGLVKPGTTLYIPFATYDSNDPTASVTMTGLATTDIEIYKDGSVTQRASDSGYALLDTDGIDFDSVTGLHGFSVDLADNTTAGFYAGGSQYWIVVSSVTVDAGVVSFIAATFRIGYPDALLNTTIATLASQTSFTLTAGPAEDDALNGSIVAIHDVASAVQVGYGVISDYVGSTKTVTLTAGTTFTAAATDNISVYPPSNINWISSQTVTAAAAVTVNAEIGASATAMDNFEDQYDGTGISGDNYPATQSQLSGLTVASSALSVPVIAAPNGFVLTTGSEVNDEDSTTALDGTRHELTDAAGTLDGYYIFDIGAFGAPISVSFQAVVNGGNDTFGIYVNTGTTGTPVWSQRGSITGSGSATNATYEVDLFESDTPTDATDRVWVRVYGTGLTTSSFDTDQLLLSRAVQFQYSGYDNGAVWVNTVSGTAGTTSGYHGIASRPSLTWANALTIASNVGLNAYQFTADSSITLTATINSARFMGNDTAIALGGQDISGCHLFGMDVTGIGTGADEINFHDCHINAVTVSQSHFYRCSLTSTLTLSAAADYFLVDCYSEVAGASSPTIDMGAAVGATNLSVRRWAGGITLNNLAAGDVVTLDGVFGTITLNGADAQVEIRGIAKAVTNNLTGSPTVNDDTLKTDIQEDWTDGGRLDAILDSILAMLDDPRAEPGQGAPAVNADAMTKIDYLYKALRNKTEQTATTMSIYNDAGTVVDHKATVSDDGTTATKEELVSGP